MLAQVLGVQGAVASTASFSDLAPARMADLGAAELHAIVVGFLNTSSLKHARFVVRRLKRTRPASRVGIVFTEPLSHPSSRCAEPPAWVRLVAGVNGRCTVRCCDVTTRAPRG